MDALNRLQDELQDLAASIARVELETHTRPDSRSLTLSLQSLQKRRRVLAEQINELTGEHRPAVRSSNLAEKTREREPA